MTLNQLIEKAKEKGLDLGEMELRVKQGEGSAAVIGWTLSMAGKGAVVLAAAKPRTKKVGGKEVNEDAERKEVEENG